MAETTFGKDFANFGLFLRCLRDRSRLPTAGRIEVIARRMIEYDRQVAIAADPDRASADSGAEVR